MIRKEKKEKIVSVAIPMRQWEAIKDRSRLKKVSASAVIRQGIRLELSQPIKKPLAN